MSTDAVLRLALASGRLPDLHAQAMRAAVNGFWLGVLSDERLQALDELYYNREQAYRTTEWNTRGLFDWERAAVAEHFGGGGRIAVAACGGGREVLALREDGFDAVGFEPHPQLARYGRELLEARGHRGSVHLAPRDVLPAGEPCDGIVVGWGGYSLIHGRRRRIAFLRSARERLKPGAPLLMSVFERGVLGRELRLTCRVATALRRIRGRDPVELGDTLAPNRVHVFDPAQIAGEAADGGLEVVDHRIIGRPDGRTDYAAAVLRVA